MSDHLTSVRTTFPPPNCGGVACRLLNGEGPIREAAMPVFSSLSSLSFPAFYATTADLVRDVEQTQPHIESDPRLQRRSRTITLEASVMPAPSRQVPLGTHRACRPL